MSFGEMLKISLIIIGFAALMVSFFVDNLIFRILVALGYGLALPTSIIYLSLEHTLKKWGGESKTLLEDAYMVKRIADNELTMYRKHIEEDKKYDRNKYTN